MKVLFSCLGSTDPVRGLRDGGMLHIVRHYLPEKIIWYISAQMKQDDDRDNRYQLAMDRFCSDHPGYKPEIVRIYSDVEDVSQFDIFYEPFEQVIFDITKEYPDAEILLNLSSGSPQMKMTMALLAMDARYHTKGIQVKSPERQANTAQRTTSKKYDAVTEIELNEDNEPGAEDRTEEPQLFFLRRQAERQRLETLLQTYNYTALAAMKTMLPPSCRALVTHLAQRSMYNLQQAKETAEKLRNRLPFPLYPMRQAKTDAEQRVYQYITEYYLCLKLMQKQGQLTNCIIRTTPFIVRLQEAYLRNRCQFVIQEIIEGSKIRPYITRSKVHAYSEAMEEHLDHELGMIRQNNDVSVHMCNSLIRFFIEPEQEKDLQAFDLLERLNEICRNQTAHNLESLTEQDMQNAIGCGSEQLLKLLEKLIRTTFPDVCSPSIFDIYDTCNAYIMRQL